MDRIETLKALLQQEPEDSFVRHALALEYVKRNDDAAARHLFEALLQQNPAYTGSYYHLGKLLERMGEKQLAADWYQKGMDQARKSNERHAYNELQAAYEDLAE